MASTSTTDPGAPTLQLKQQQIKEIGTDTDGIKIRRLTVGSGDKHLYIFVGLPGMGGKAEQIIKLLGQNYNFQDRKKHYVHSQDQIIQNFQKLTQQDIRKGVKYLTNKTKDPQYILKQVATKIGKGTTPIIVDTMDPKDIKTIIELALKETGYTVHVVKYDGKTVLSNPTTLQGYNAKLVQLGTKLGKTFHKPKSGQEVPQILKKDLKQLLQNDTISLKQHQLTQLQELIKESKLSSSKQVNATTQPIGGGGFFSTFGKFPTSTSTTFKSTTSTPSTTKSNIFSSPFSFLRKKQTKTTNVGKGGGRGVVIDFSSLVKSPLTPNPTSTSTSPTQQQKFAKILQQALKKNSKTTQLKQFIQTTIVSPQRQQFIKFVQTKTKALQSSSDDKQKYTQILALLKPKLESPDAVGVVESTPPSSSTIDGKVAKVQLQTVEGQGGDEGGGGSSTTPRQQSGQGGGKPQSPMDPNGGGGGGEGVGVIQSQQDKRRGLVKDRAKPQGTEKQQQLDAAAGGQGEHKPPPPPPSRSQSLTTIMKKVGYNQHTLENALKQQYAKYKDLSDIQLQQFKKHLQQEIARQGTKEDRKNAHKVRLQKLTQLQNPRNSDSTTKTTARGSLNPNIFSDIMKIRDKGTQQVPLPLPPPPPSSSITGTSSKSKVAWLGDLQHKKINLTPPKPPSQDSATRSASKGGGNLHNILAAGLKNVRRGVHGKQGQQEQQEDDEDEDDDEWRPEPVTKKPK